MTKIALRGIMSRGFTAPIQLYPGSPLSRAKANVWREVDAKKDVAPARPRTMMMTVKPTAPPLLPVPV